MILVGFPVLWVIKSGERSGVVLRTIQRVVVVLIEIAFVIYAVASLAVMYGLLVTIDRDRKAMYAERSELLNRIKPETAQIPNVSTMEMVEPIRSDDDYWSAHEGQLKDDGSYPYGFDEEIKGR